MNKPKMKNQVRKHLKEDLRESKESIKEEKEEILKEKTGMTRDRDLIKHLKKSK